MLAVLQRDNNNRDLLKEHHIEADLNNRFRLRF